MENRKIKILAIDDNQINLISLKELVKETFPKSVFFSEMSGIKGIELAKSKDPDVILLDILMPEMDGFEVCKKLKSDKKLCDIPVIFITSLGGDKESRMRALDCGGEAFLSKPVDQIELIAQIRAMLKIKTANIEKRNEKERLSKLVDKRTTELKKELRIRAITEAELREKEVQYRNLADSGLALIWTSGYDKLRNYFNEPWLKYTGKTSVTELYVEWEKCIHPDDFENRLQVYETAFDKREKFDVEYRLRNAAGEYLWIRDLGTPNYNRKGEFIGYIGHCFDISEQKKTELAMIEAKEKAEESDRLKSAFLANMSHEIRTPMNSILGFAGLLKDSDNTIEEQQQFIATIEKSGARMLFTINDIIDISKIESGQMDISIAITNINEQIEEVHTFLANEAKQKGLEIYFYNTLNAKDAIIETDNEKIYAILTNLVRNAIKFTREGVIEFGYKLKDNYLEFFVKDTGVGISQEQQKIIFKRFRQGSESFSRDFEGSGLGLTISKAYVEMLGGKIWVESEIGKGSVFYFTIPYHVVRNENKVINSVALSENEENQISKLKILIAEDDKPSEWLITRYINKISKEILIARSGTEAVEICRNNPDIDLILMDVKMPDMNGYDATKQIRAFNKDVIIISQTAYALLGDRETAIEIGCNDYISKPIQRHELMELIKKHFLKS